jgi:uroporphyrinogen-III decarboxylase
MSLERLIDEVNKIGQQNKQRTLLDKEIRIMVGIGRGALASKLGFNLIDYFRDPGYCLKYQLEQKLFLYENFNNADNQVDATVGIDFGVGLEASLFVMQVLFYSQKDPMYGDPIIEKEGDLGKLKYPDFYQSGLMPEVHRFYSRFKSLLNGKLKVTFPGWARGPWSMAQILRGFTQLSLDIMDRPQFVHRMMSFLTNARIKWEQQRAKFLGEDFKDKKYRWKYYYVDYRPANHSDLYNDEVDGNLFSPEVYKEFIFPYENKLSHFYGGIRYYHSCGNLIPFLDYLKKLPGLEKLHIGPWTDLKVAKTKLNHKIRLQKCMNPEDDIFSCNEKEMRQKIIKIIQDGKGTKLDICADAIHSPSSDLEKVKSWVKMVHEFCKER